MKKNISNLILLIATVTLLISAAYLQEACAEDFPQSGVLAANGNLPSGTLALPQLPMGLDGRKVPFVASLSRGQDNYWHYSIENKSDQSLRVEFEIAQYDIDLNKISSVSRSFKLKSGANEKDKAQIVPKTQGAALILKSWK